MPLTINIKTNFPQLVGRAKSFVSILKRIYFKTQKQNFYHNLIA